MNNGQGYMGIKLALILVVILCLLGATSAVVKWGDSMTPARTITVSAEATVNVPPDTATVSFSEVTIGTDPIQIESQNVDQINNAISFLEQQDVTSTDITTTDYNLSPNYGYNYRTGSTTISGYTITETESVKITNFTKIPTILAGLSNLGVNQIGQVSFSVENQDSDLASARSQAFAKAQAKAQQIAQDNGVALGEVINITDSNNSGEPMPLYGEFASPETSNSAAVPTIEPGTNQLTDTVTVTYAIQ